jgi:hypothetical protein
LRLQGWRTFNGVLVLAGFTNGVLGVDPDARMATSGEVAVEAVILFVPQLVVWPLMMLVGLGIQAINPWSARRWEYPTWDQNPFDFSQPLRFSHMLVAPLAATAIGSALAAFWRPLRSGWEIGAPLGMASGLWLGLQIVWRAYKWKHQ